MNEQDQKVYMSLSNDPNERGRLWKEYKEKRALEATNTSSGIKKLTNIEIVELYRDMTIAICSAFAPPEEVAKMFDKNLLKEIKLHEMDK